MRSRAPSQVAHVASAAVAQTPPLPYRLDARAAYVEGNARVPHGKHRQAYVTKLNELIEGTEFEAGARESSASRRAACLICRQVWNTFSGAACIGSRRRPAGGWHRRSAPSGVRTRRSGRRSARRGRQLRLGWTARKEGRRHSRHRQHQRRRRLTTRTTAADDRRLGAPTTSTTATPASSSRPSSRR